MQVNAVTELLGIANYKVAYIAHHSEKKIELVVQPQELKPCVCSLVVARYTILQCTALTW